MVKNSDLFRKIMMFSKEIKLSAFKMNGPMGGPPGFPPGAFPHGPGQEMHGKPPFPAGFDGVGKQPFGPHGDCKPPFPPGFDGAGKPPFGPHGDCKPPFPPHGFGKDPGGPMGPGMGRERVLVILSDHPEGMRQKELAEEAGINASTASEMITKLEDTGYVVRTADETDRRATVLKLTEMGTARAEEIRGEREAFLDEFFSKLTEEEKQTLSDLLDKLMEE
jgi:DNA-binding MarR family transcriptional regulator